jgi:hypothetical protein
VPEYKNMVTLTYPHAYPLDGKLCKDHLRRFLQEIKRDSSHNGDLDSRWSAFWFMEFQSRGAFHFHIFLTSRHDKKWVAKVWYRIVGSDDDRHLQAGTRIEKLKSGRHGTISYATKYASKHSQKEIPDNILNAGRFWGVVGCRVAMSADTTIDASIRSVPAVRRALEKLNTTVKKLVQSGEVKIIKRDGGVVCGLIKTSRAKHELSVAFSRVEMQNLLNGYTPSFTLPHQESERDASGLFQ